jgi:hypothetical protein
MSIVSSPLNFNDLKAASVYYELLACNPANLQAIFPQSQFEKKNDGTMAYYNITANGSYVRADGNRGEFVKLTRSDGHEIFLHYSQVFGPTAAARRKMNTLTYVLGVTYQNTYRQMAMLNDLINEAASLNEAMRKLDKVYYSFAASAINFDSGAEYQILPIAPDLLRLYVDNGLRFPVNSIRSGLVPQLYRFAVGDPWIGPTFFVRYDGTIVLVDVWSWRDDWYNTPRIMDIITNPGKALLQFSSNEKFTFSDHALSFLGFDKCYFDSKLNMKWERVHTEDVCIATACYSTRTTTPDKVLNGYEVGCTTQTEINAFLDQIRIAIDQLNNKLSGISTMIGVHNQDLQQNYTVATSAIEATEEAQQKTARNIH